MTKNRDISKILDQNTTFTATLSVGSGTANVFANSTIVKLANSTVNTAIVVPTSAQFTGSYFLHANGTWQLAGGLPGGSDTYMQFNDGGTSLNGTAGFTFTKGTNNAVIANTLTVGASGNTINSTVWTGKSYTANDSTNLGGTAAASYQLNSTLAANVATMTANNATWHGTSVFANSTGAYPTSNSVGAVIGNTISRVIITGNSATFISTLAAGDTTVTGFVNATTVVNSAAHTIGTTLIANTIGVYHTGIVNAASHTTTGFLANATHVVPTSNSSGQTFGNTISRWVMTANSLTVSGGASPDSNTLGTALGTTTQRWVIIGNSATFSSTLAATDTTITGFVNATTVVNSAAHTVGTAFIANTLGVYHTGTMNAASFTTTGLLANTTGIVPTSNSSGQNFGNTISRWVIIANSAALSTSLTADTVNTVTSVNSALVTVGTAFVANTTGAYHTGTVNAASFTTTGFRANTIGTYPTSNSSGQLFGNTISRWAIFANTIDVTTSVTANGSLGSAAQVLTSNSLGGVYWATAGGGNVSKVGTPVDDQVGVWTGDGTIEGTAGFTFSAASNNAFVANTLTAGSVNATVSVNSALIKVGTDFIANTFGVFHTGFMNATAYVTTGFLANLTHVVPTSNSSGHILGDLTRRYVITANSATVSGGVYPDSNTLGTALGSTTQRWVLTANTIESTGLANLSALNVVNQTNTATFFATTSANVGANIQANTTTILVGNSTVNTVIGNTQIAIGNTTINAVANSSAFKLANSTVTWTLIKPTAAQVTSADYYPAADGVWKQVSVSGGASYNMYSAYGAL